MLPASVAPSSTRPAPAATARTPTASRSPAPDLRRIGMACHRVMDPALRQRCQSDADHFFVKSVRYGKQKFGIVHMPPWDSVLEPALVWSLRSFVETAPRD